MDADAVAGYRENFRDYYIGRFNPLCRTDCNLQGVDYPAQFWPVPLPGWGGLQGAKWDVSTNAGLQNLTSTLGEKLPTASVTNPIIIAGYSQGANVASAQKRLLADADPSVKQNLSFMLIGNPNRPNGGLFERLALLGHVPILDVTFGNPTPTNIGIKTTDIAFEYDGVTDFPVYVLNALADVNAVLGFVYVHGTYLDPNAKGQVTDLPDGYTPHGLAEQEDPSQHPENFQNHGDTTYVTIPTHTLPIVRPFLDLAAATGTTQLVQPVVDLISPALRVLVDTGYDRSDYGRATTFRLLPVIDPARMATDLVTAMQQGVAAAAADLARTSTWPRPADDIRLSDSTFEKRAAINSARSPVGNDQEQAAVRTDNDTRARMPTGAGTQSSVPMGDSKGEPGSGVSSKKSSDNTHHRPEKNVIDKRTEPSKVGLPRGVWRRHP